MTGDSKTHTTNDTSRQIRPDVTRIEYNFPTEDGLRTTVWGGEFNRMQPSDIEFSNASGPNRQVAPNGDRDAARIWLQNGHSIRYVLLNETTVREETFRSGSPDSAHTNSEFKLPQAGRPMFIAVVRNAISEYLSSCNWTVEDFEQKWVDVYKLLAD